MILNVSDAKHLKEYEIWLKFDNGLERIVDLKDTIFSDHRKVFEPLRKAEYFKKFTIRYNTIVWPNEVDFAPEFLYEIGKEIKKAA
ncbi:MAG: DUF2442 domain-containing protein [bacterium]|nr:DUF2442 domain-containing protein [bacterium]